MSGCEVRAQTKGAEGSYIFLQVFLLLKRLSPKKKKPGETSLTNSDSGSDAQSSFVLDKMEIIFVHEHPILKNPVEVLLRGSCHYFMHLHL